MQTWAHPALWPFLVAASSAGVFALVASVVPPGRLRGGIVALGLSVAWGAGLWFAARAPQWPPTGADGWQFYAVLLAGAAAVAGPLWRGGSWRPVAAGGILLAVFFVSQAPGFSLVVGLWVAGCALLALANLWSVAAVGRSVQAAVTLFALAVFALVVGAVLDFSVSASAGQSAQVFAAGSGAVWLVSLALRRQLDLRPSGLVAAVVLGGLLAHAGMAGRLGAVSVLLLACAWPVAALAARLLHRQSGMVRGVAVVLLLVVLCFAALWTAKI